jgi:hypothetical protein
VNAYTALIVTVHNTQFSPNQLKHLTEQALRKVTDSETHVDIDEHTGACSKDLCNRTEGLHGVSTDFWIVGNLIERAEGQAHARWEFLGVFDERSLAVAACTLPTHFIGPARRNRRAPDEPHEWEGCEYPLASKS